MRSTDSDRLTQAAAFKTLTQSRRSIRGFLTERLNQTVLDSIFDAANNAPSNCNTQPWQAYVASGAKRDALSQQLVASIGIGKHVLDFPYESKYSGEYRQRQLDVGLMLYQALGITRKDSAGKKRAFMRNLEFFDAPHVVFLFMPDWCGLREAIDVGMYAQNLMLSMHSHGVASCPQTILGYNADVVRGAFEVEAEMKLLFGISFGLEDTALAENKIVPSRAALSDNTHFFE